MKNTLKIDFDNKLIIMDRTFSQNVKNTRSDEYMHLQNVRRDYPDYSVVTRKIKAHPGKRKYDRLSYAYMEEYILKHGTPEEVREALEKYRELREIARCHGKGYGYPIIKSWFINRYEEIRNFGVVPLDGFDDYDDADFVEAA